MDYIVFMLLTLTLVILNPWFHVGLGGLGKFDLGSVWPKNIAFEFCGVKLHSGMGLKFNQY